MPQTNYSIDRVQSIPGQVVSQDCVVGHYQASESIPFGRVTELHTDGKLRLFRGGKRVGIAMYRDAKSVTDGGDGSWQTDDFVPVLREGQIYAEFAGTPSNVSDYQDANVCGADTTTTDRGKLTDASSTSTADGEIYDATGVKYLGTPIASTMSNGDSQTVVLVEVDMAGLRERTAPTLLAQTSNDFAVPTTSKHGQVIELDTTAAASTVSLPAALSDGTVLYFLANGTKNGHTLTFRDVVTSISAATTASKRVAAVAVKASGKWAVTLTVGP